MRRSGRVKSNEVCVGWNDCAISLNGVAHHPRDTLGFELRRNFIKRGVIQFGTANNPL